MSDIVFKYHGGGIGGAWPLIPARDLTADDLVHLKEEHEISEKTILATNLYTKVKPQKIEKEVTHD